MSTSLGLGSVAALSHYDVLTRIKARVVAALIWWVMTLGGCTFSGRFDPPAVMPSSMLSLPFPLSLLPSRTVDCTPFVRRDLDACGRAHDVCSSDELVRSPDACCAPDAANSAADR